MATKSNYATKEDLERGLKKLENKIDTNFATKDDLKAFATKDDLDDLRDDISTQFEDWRSDFYTKIDPILKEISKNDEERTIMNHKINKNSARITKLEKVVSAN